MIDQCRVVFIFFFWWFCFFWIKKLFKKREWCVFLSFHCWGD